MIFPKVKELVIPSWEPESNVQGLGIDFAYDFKKKEFILEAGQPKQVNGKAAVAVWIEKVIRTQLFRWPIYLPNIRYGTDIEDLIVGKTYPMPFLEAEMKRELTEALLKHPEIQFIDGWVFQLEDEFLHVIFVVHLLHDEILTREVVFDGIYR